MLTITLNYKVTKSHDFLRNTNKILTTVNLYPKFVLNIIKVTY